MFTGFVTDTAEKHKQSAATEVSNRDFIVFSSQSGHGITTAARKQRKLKGPGDRIPLKAATFESSKN